jgi:chemotaxis protein histidine kinase CheA
VTAAPVEKQVNGQTRPPMPVLGEWRAVTAEPVEEQSIPQAEPAAAETQVDVEVARARAWAEAEERRVAAEAAAEERRIIAQAEADAIRAKAEEDARKARLANDRAERKAREEEEASAARIAEHQRRREEAERARADAARQAEEKQQAEAEKAETVEKSSKRWRNVALGFYGLCAAVALPVQMAAFWDPKAQYLLVAPVFIEVIALVALVGAAAAVTDGRPQWHYRLVAWVGALTAATINVVHGLDAFDPATAFGTALASVAGPGMWDLHEHGRIRKRDGKPSWRERRAQEKTAKEEGKRQAAEEARKRAEKEAADKAAEEARQRLAGERQREFPKVWAEAVKIGAALGKAPDDPAVWARAYRNIEGTEPGETIESITARRAAEKRVESALSGTPVSTLSKTTNAQRAIQVKTSSRRSSYKPVPPTRKPGDTPPFHPVARRLHGDTKRRLNAAKNDRPNAL